MLIIDRQTRTIAGRAVPWDVARVSNRLLCGFVKNSLTWQLVGSVKLLLQHDHSLIVGRAIELSSTEDGLWSVFRVANGSRGDRAMALAAHGWGLSVGLGAFTYELRGDARWIDYGELIEISLVSNPGFPQKES